MQNCIIFIERPLSKCPHFKRKKIQEQLCKSFEWYLLVI